MNMNKLEDQKKNEIGKVIDRLDSDQSLSNNPTSLRSLRDKRMSPSVQARIAIECLGS